MRRLLIAVLLAQLLFAYAGPPLEEVGAHNSGIAAGLLNYSDPYVPELTRFEPAHVNMSTATPWPAVGGRVPSNFTEVYWAWAEEYLDGNVVRWTTDRGCEREVRMTLMGRNSSVEYYNIFQGQNRSAGIGMDEQPLPVLFAYAELDNSTGNDTIEFMLEWEFEYLYWVEVLKWQDEENCVNGSCDCVDAFHSDEMVSITVGGKDTKEYFVDAGVPEFMVVKPLLGEQWHMNNRFDCLVFSKRKIYYGEKFLDGNSSAEARIYNFSIMEDALGVWHIEAEEVSNFSNMSFAEEDGGVYSPVPLLQENESFAFAYLSYFAYGGVGRHNLTVEVKDWYGNGFNYTEEILSRKLSHSGGYGEDGLPVSGSGDYRPSYAAPEGELGKVLIPSNILAVLIVLASVSIFWARKRRG